MALTSTQSQNDGCLKSLWKSLESSSESSESSTSTSSTLFTSSMEASAQSVNWLTVSRGGLAKLVGLAMVPSQFLGPDLESSKLIIQHACQMKHNGECTVETIQLEHGTGFLNGVICYPLGWNRNDTSRCVVYHNPNGITVPQFFEDGVLSWTPGEILSLKKCPVILYDYRGTGLNQGEYSSSSSQFRPTYESIVVDGLTVLDYAFKKFENVDVWGSSLGGGVATASLERHLSKNPNNAKRVSITNHDSFSTTPRVVLPGYPRVANGLGWLLGGNLDAQTPMESLIERGVKVTVLCHQQDPVIPAGARMAEIVSDFKNRENVSLIYSQQYGHANLSYDMLQKL